MGCGSGSIKLIEEGVEEPIDYKMESCNIDVVDETCDKTIPLIKEIEELRCIIVDRKFEIFLRTGACSLKNPDMFRSFECLYMKLSTDTKGDINEAELTVSDNEPYITLGGHISNESSECVSIIIEYIIRVKGLGERMDEMIKFIPELQEVAYGKSLEGLTDMIRTKHADVPPYIPIYVGKFNKNIIKIKSAIVKAQELVRNLKSTLTEITRGLHLIEQKEEIDKINKIGKKESSANITQPHEISWPYIPSKDKFLSALEGFEYWSEKVKRVKHRYILNS